MSGFTCPYCGMVMSISSHTNTKRTASFDGFTNNANGYSPSSLCLDFYNCPNCNEYTISVEGLGDGVTDVSMQIRPNSLARKFPSYIPKAIRSDYEEACAIVSLSPKASATLSRRCLQGMIRDFHGIKKNTLYDEISALKDTIDPSLWSSLDSLRQLGNIGAHMEKDTNLIVDIDPDEAQTLIKLIELLMKEWYINRHEREELLSSIVETNRTKQIERKS